MPIAGGLLPSLRYPPASPRDALAIFRDIGDRDGEAWASNGLGEAALTAGRLGAALGHHTAALRTATEIGGPDQQARHPALGHAYRILAEDASQPPRL